MERKAGQSSNYSLVRLHKLMAEAGVASRRKCEELILAGAVKVDGRVVKELGFKVDPSKNLIEVKGKRISPPGKKVYILLNKPSGYITTVKDTHGRPTIVDLVKSETRVFPVGRLDKNTEGLLLLTNDGELANKLASPRYEIDKIYKVVVKGTPGKVKLNRLRKGIVLKEGKTAPAGIEKLWQTKNRTALEIAIHQGWKRQIRRMCEAIGHPVISLKRIKLGPLTLEGLPKGAYRLLNKNEIESLKDFMNIEAL